MLSYELSLIINEKNPRLGNERCNFKPLALKTV
jgi:hypothetical protein